MQTRRTKPSTVEHCVGTGNRKYSPREEAIYHCVQGVDPTGFTIREINGEIGKGVFADQDFNKGSFLMEYRGQLFHKTQTAAQSEETFLYFFSYKGETRCIDATTTTCLGRYVNDGVSRAKNAEVRVIDVDNTPHLCLFASKKINTGDEIRFDYGVKTLPWRLKTTMPYKDLCLQSNKDSVVLKNASGTVAAKSHDQTDQLYSCSRDHLASLNTRSDTSEPHTTDLITINTAKPFPEPESINTCNQVQPTTQKSPEQRSVSCDEEWTINQHANIRCEVRNEIHAIDLITINNAEYLEALPQPKETNTCNHGQLTTKIPSGKTNVLGDEKWTTQNTNISNETAEIHATDLVTINTSQQLETLLEPQKNNSCILDQLTTENSADQRSAPNDEHWTTQNTNISNEKAEIHATDLVTINTSQQLETLLEPQKNNSCNLDQLTTQNSADQRSAPNDEHWTTQNTNISNETAEIHATDLVTINTYQQLETLLEPQSNNSCNLDQLTTQNSADQRSAPNNEHWTTQNTNISNETAEIHATDLVTINTYQQLETLLEPQSNNSCNLDQLTTQNSADQRSAPNDEHWTTQNTNIRSDRSKIHATDLITINTAEYLETLPELDKCNTCTQGQRTTKNPAGQRRVSADEDWTTQHASGITEIHPTGLATNTSQHLETLSEPENGNTFNQDQLTIQNSADQRSARNDEQWTTQNTNISGERAEIHATDLVTINTSQQLETLSTPLNSNTCNQGHQTPNNDSLFTPFGLPVEDPMFDTNNDLSDTDYATPALEVLETKPMYLDKTNINIQITGIASSEYPVNGTKKKKKQLRVFNKKSSCVYCGFLTTNISSHYRIHHSEECEVSKILAVIEMGESKKRVKSEWELLRNAGNHAHNQKVIESKKGELMVVRRKRCETFSVDNYTPCPQCKGWYFKASIAVHVNRRCVKKSLEKMKSSAIQKKSHLHKFGKSMDKLDSEVFLSMRKDNITKTAKEDSIIRRVGLYYFEKHKRNRLRCKNFASKHMRQAASLLLKVREIDQSSFDLEHYLVPQKYSVIEKAAIELAGGQCNSYSDVKFPSTLKNLGYEVKHYAQIKEEIGIENQDAEKVTSCKYFLKLYKRRWALLASSAQKQLEERNYNQQTQLPSQDDIEKVTSYIKQSLGELEDSWSENNQYRDVAELVQARLVLFNKRRPGELEALRLDDWAKRTNNDTVLSTEVMNTFTALEKKLLETHQVVHVRGKRGHAVPILIPPDCSAAITKLTDTDVRKRAGVKDSNPYLFANTGEEVFRAVHSLKNVLRRAECNAISCTLVKASNLRKYLATNCQLLNLNDSELDWVTRHLGHSKLTHLNNYRLTSSTIERTKVAKLLVIMENGLLTDATGKNLSDNKLDELILQKTGCSEEEDVCTTGTDPDQNTEYPADEDTSEQDPFGTILKDAGLRPRIRKRVSSDTNTGTNPDQNTASPADEDTSEQDPFGKILRDAGLRPRIRKLVSSGTDTGETVKENVGSPADEDTSEQDPFGKILRDAGLRPRIRKRVSSGTDTGETVKENVGSPADEDTSEQDPFGAILRDAGLRPRIRKRVSSDTDTVSEASGISDEEWTIREDDNTTSSDVEDEEPLEQPRKVARVRRRNIPWNETAVNVLKREFKDELETNTYPSYRYIRKIRDKYPALLSFRSEAQIKSKISHLMRK